MTKPLGNYSFLPWLRLGLANQIAAGSEPGRAVINVELDLKGPAVSGTGEVTGDVKKQVALFGPGDILGIERRAIVRTDPRDWITNFEPNYFPAIEFYDEDFPWRYTPDAPDAKGRLVPWLTLLVLQENEFTDGKDMTGKPLPYIEVEDTTKCFPPLQQLWAWAHVHVNRGLADDIVSTDMNTVLPRLKGVLDENADLALSRIVSSRKLASNKPYHAFVIPTFESGRRAGLGIDPYTNPAPTTTIAWEKEDRPEKPRFPYYYRWYFHTGGEGDFESLVRLLKPRPVDFRVGRRDVDVQSPGLNVRSVDTGRTDLHGILKLGGALTVPEKAMTTEQVDEKNKYENWASGTLYPQPIQQDIAQLVNLADDYAGMSATAANDRANILDPDRPNPTVREIDPDPVITPPLYGMWHAMTKRLLKTRAGGDVTPNRNWVHELNLDPRFRMAAGFGTQVVQDQQETYMNAAWEQLGDVLEGNRLIRLGQAACAVTTSWYDRSVVPLMATDRQKGLQLAGPLNKRVLIDGQTVHHYYTETYVTPTMTTGAMRRIMRPRGRLIRSLPFDTTTPVRDLFDQMRHGEGVTPAPPRNPQPPKKPIELPRLGETVIKEIDPKKTIPKRVKSRVRFPKRVQDEVGDGFVEAMAYPEINTPMYEPLKNLSSELFLPNVNLISENSVTLLEPNRKFIEAYMAGLNHEFARELLWREYPTDQRGSYFRQFWDVTAAYNYSADPPADRKENLRDILKLHEWKPDSQLGSHNKRVAEGGGGEVVLVIRGELLKRYPTAVIYAHRAEWPTDRNLPRRLVELTDAEEASPPRDKILTPIYDAKVDPDVYFFGFSLTVDQARGGSGAPGDQDPGWFFVLKERPGEPRFGLDIDKQTTLHVWDDLSWPLVQPALPGAFVEIDASQAFTLQPPLSTDPKSVQYADDQKVAWSVDMSAADLAYILFQAPVLVAMHASEMLPPKNTP